MSVKNDMVLPVVHQNHVEPSGIVYLDIPMYIEFVFDPLQKTPCGSGKEENASAPTHFATVSDASLRSLSELAPQEQLSAYHRHLPCRHHPGLEDHNHSLKAEIWIGSGLWMEDEGAKGEAAGTVKVSR